LRIRTAVVLFCAAANAFAADKVLSHDWRDGKLTLKLDDGSAEIEWITPIAFHVTRVWGSGDAPVLPKISHEAISPALEDQGPSIVMKTRYVTLEVDRADMALRVSAGGSPVANHLLVRANNRAELQLNLKPDEKTFGGAQFVFTRDGYGIYYRDQQANSIDYCFYYGPSPKEIFEQHSITMGANEVKSDKLDLLTREQLPKQATIVETASTPAQLAAKLIDATLSGAVYPAVDVATVGDGRMRDLFTMLPIVFGSKADAGIDVATRAKWRPYLITYLREAYDRGYPLIRPLAMQFWHDANSDKQNDVFMLGDEVLLAPASGAKRKLDLPRGTWTDFRTNTEYKGNQTIEVDAPVGQVPTFVRNGWIVPWEFPAKMELHYFPSLGGEFFLWEPNLTENSQFHAAPAGDYMRVEMESKIARTYEWVIHHTKAPREVEDSGTILQHVDSLTAMKPGTWWHDDGQDNLHIMVRCDANTDRIVNMSF
jgi:hypothetical protein